MTTQFDIPHYFKKAIVRRPCENMVQGLTEADMGSPDFDLACQQHEDYVEALKECNLEVTELETFPLWDSIMSLKKFLGLLSIPVITNVIPDK